MMTTPVTLIKKCVYLLKGGELQHNIFFLHIPKCGGKSLDQALRRQEPFSYWHLKSAPSFEAATHLYRLNDPTTADFDEVQKFREHLLLYAMHDNTRVISGHFSFSERVYQRFGERYAFVTLLRDPVKRWISLYFYHRYKSFQTPTKIEDDIIPFLHSQRGSHQGHCYIQMIGGIAPDNDYRSAQAIARARENLHKFALVGCLEYLDDFVNRFEDRFGKRLNIPKKNRNPQSRDEIHSMVTEEIYQEITRISQPDIELYQYAVKTFVSIPADEPVG